MLIQKYKINIAIFKYKLHCNEIFFFIFLTKYSNFIIRKQKFLTIYRKNVYNFEIIAKIFRNYKIARTKYNVINNDCFNMNKIDFKINIDENQYIVTRMSHRKFIIKNLNNCEFFIIIEIIRDDNTIFFYIIFNDKQHIKKVICNYEFKQKYYV